MRTITQQCKYLKKVFEEKLKDRPEIISFHYEPEYRLVRYFSDGMLLAKFVVGAKGEWQCVFNSCADRGYAQPRHPGDLCINHAGKIHPDKLPLAIHLKVS